MSHVYCTECGFQNPETANYCSRCGALLEKGDAPVEATQTFAPEEVADAQHELVEGLEGPALVVRFGGGRAGESFGPPARARASAARPSARSSSTTSPSRATTRCSSSATGRSPSRTRAR